MESGQKNEEDVWIRRENKNHAKEKENGEERGNGGGERGEENREGEKRGKETVHLLGNGDLGSQSYEKT